jgi:aspartate racemase
VKSRSRMSHAPVLGILGGMGPLATARFYEQVVRATPALTDQGHVHVVIWADPSVPDRSAALVSAGVDPTGSLAYGAQRLESMGATILAVPCNTAHAFMAAIRGAVAIPVLDIIAVTTRHVSDCEPPDSAVGLLASDGVLASRIYETSLAKHGIHTVIPSPAIQASRVTPAIARIKSGDLGRVPRALLADAIAHLGERGARRIVAGCTELALVLEARAVGLPIVDPSRLLAVAAVAAVRDREGRGHFDRRDSCSESPDDVSGSHPNHDPGSVRVDR